ncbi:MAG: osmotically inducible protein OsmC [Bdellovibrionales bacterium GWA2_49_15]|nr:MAG: osmotically inducible protein OsmC [Bdellovibrionales bacterium GWA2_49_15]HAZ14717.1 osmotically inducible protein OsmC [Bdellovibrionales bacterium]
MEMRIHFIRNKKVTADFNGFSVVTDQPQSGGGDASAPAPFDLFLASIGTCAGIFILNFCQKREIPTEGIELIQRSDWDSTKHLVTKVTLEINVPKEFPEKYRESLINAANLCTVKRHLHEPPQFEVITKLK